AQKDGVKLSVLHAQVSAQGKVRLNGQLKKETAPVIEVEFAKHEGSYSKTAQWSYQVIKQARAKWHFKTMNLVGIGTGNMGLLNCLTRYADAGQLPSLAKQVAIAGPFNGTHIQPNADSKLMKNGCPYHMNMLYHELLGLKKTYPKSTVVLNIYGNQGSHSDGIVANSSSRALKYLVTPRAKSYQEQAVKGTRAGHDQLTRNPQVQTTVIKFLWK
ncbi:MAG: alpha/beta hydrolase, partial [Limosilactobacillus mucosae]